MNTKEDRLNIRIAIEFKQRIQQQAVRENRTVASFVTNVLKTYLDKVEKNQTNGADAD